MYKLECLRVGKSEIQGLLIGEASKKQEKF